MSFYILSTDDFGEPYWDGPYAARLIQLRVASGSLEAEVAIRDEVGHVARAGDLLPTGLLSPKVSLGKILLGLVGGVAAYKVGKSIAKFAAMTKEQKSIQRSAQRHSRKGANVCADHIEWPCRPELMGRRRADVVARYPNGRTVVEEHETPRSANRRHSIEQDRDLRRWASRKAKVTYRQVIAD
jgi:hypothetical protein